MEIPRRLGSLRREPRDSLTILHIGNAGRECSSTNRSDPSDHRDCRDLPGVAIGALVAATAWNMWRLYGLFLPVQFLYWAFNREGDAALFVRTFRQFRLPVIWLVCCRPQAF